jgi:hypothetical protein
MMGVGKPQAQSSTVVEPHFGEVTTIIFRFKNDAGHVRS